MKMLIMVSKIRSTNKKNKSRKNPLIITMTIPSDQPLTIIKQRGSESPPLINIFDLRLMSDKRNIVSEVFSVTVVNTSGSTLSD